MAEVGDRLRNAVFRELEVGLIQRSDRFFCFPGLDERVENDQVCREMKDRSGLARVQ